MLDVGAELWRYYPFVDGPVSPPGLEVLHITKDPHDAATALVGDSLLSDAKLVLEGLYQLLHTSDESPTSLTIPEASTKTTKSEEPEASIMTAMTAWTTVSKFLPQNALLVVDSPFNGTELVEVWPAEQPESFFTFASGGLGWNGPAAVGIALA